MDNTIVGVRFLGPQERYTDDKYFKTGAEWRIGTVHNFSFSLARKFFSYPCFEPAAIDRNGLTFAASAGHKQPEVAQNFPLHAMDSEKLVQLARYEFNRIVNPEGKSLDQVRAEVRTLLVMNSLDLAEDEANANVIRRVSAEELGALLGEAKEQSPETVTTDEDNEVPIDEMSKDELYDFALKNYQVKIDKRCSLDSLRDRVLLLATKEVAP